MTSELQDGKAPAIGEGDWKRLLAFLDTTRRLRRTVTYRAVIEHLALASPAIRKLAGALEQQVWRDTQAGCPLRSALVVSQGPDCLPRQGFFECAEAAGRIDAGLSMAEQARWHAAELERVFDYAYPDEQASLAAPCQETSR